MQFGRFSMIILSIKEHEKLKFTDTKFSYRSENSEEKKLNMNVRFGVILLVVASVIAIGRVNSEEINAETMVRRDADPGVMDKLKEALKKMGKRSPDPVNPKAQALIDEIKKRLGRDANPKKITKADLLKMLKKGKRSSITIGRNAEADPGMIASMLKMIPGIGFLNPDPSILDVITDGVNAAMNAMG